MPVRRRGSAGLAGLERWVRAGVTGRAPAASAVAGVVAPLPGLSPGASLRIYRDGWFSRLRRVLADDYPALARALGEQGFDGLVRGYLAARPPRHYNIARAGEGMAGYVARRRDLAGRAFLADLARLEWAVTSVFDREDGPVLVPASLRGVAPERVAGARFPRAATAEVLVLRHPVNGYLSEAKRRRRQRMPRPARQVVAVSRVGDRVRRRVLTPPMHRLLARLYAGRPLGDALERSASESGESAGAFAARVRRWFRDWVEGGMFAEAVLP